MKNWIARNIYALMYCIDKKRNRIKPYSYETAPYCGHHYSGNSGWLTSSQYHEDIGNMVGRIGWFEIIGYTESDNWDIAFAPKKPIALWTRVLIKEPLLVEKFTFHGFLGLTTYIRKKWFFINKNKTVFQFLGFRFERKIEIK